MSVSIAIVGMACRYPDANDPAALWETVLSGRRAFRRITACTIDECITQPRRDRRVPSSEHTLACSRTNVLVHPRLGCTIPTRTHGGVEGIEYVHVGAGPPPLHPRA